MLPRLTQLPLKELASMVFLEKGHLDVLDGSFVLVDATGEGAIVDASVVPSSRRPFKVIDVLHEDRKEDDTKVSEVPASYSDDADAAWLRNGNRAYFGYKLHAATDSRASFLLDGHVTAGQSHRHARI